MMVTLVIRLRGKISTCNAGVHPVGACPPRLIGSQKPWNISCSRKCNIVTNMVTNIHPLQPLAPPMNRWDGKEGKSRIGQLKNFNTKLCHLETNGNVPSRVDNINYLKRNLFPIQKKIMMIILHQNCIIMSRH